MDCDWKAAVDDRIRRCWYGRAKYWVQTVLAEHRKNEDYFPVIKSLVYVEPEPFESLDYVARHTNLIGCLHKKNELSEYKNTEDNFWAANGMKRLRLTSKPAIWPATAVKGSRDAADPV
ncbi:hypothetical protein MEX01_39670 [Methylorubrum extorquens]|nr:hypothetical protein MEX01_39670 [Methylorubrum extorquens]